jgi:hypothetical protein
MLAKSVMQDLELLRLRICAWFNRRPGTVWTAKEIEKLRAVAVLRTTEADLALLDQWFADPKTFHRRDVQTLLNNWNAEIDRARQWAGQRQPARASYAAEWEAQNPEGITP